MYCASTRKTSYSNDLGWFFSHFKLGYHCLLTLLFVMSGGADGWKLERLTNPGPWVVLSCAALARTEGVFGTYFPLGNGTLRST